MKNFILFFIIYILSFSVNAANKYPYQGIWELIEQTNCFETISSLIIKKKNVKTSEKIKGKINPKKDSIKLGNKFKGEFSGKSLTLFSTKDDCIQKYSLLPEPSEPVPNAPDGWFFGTEQDGEFDTPFLHAAFGSERGHEPEEDDGWNEFHESRIKTEIAEGNLPRGSKLPPRRGELNHSRDLEL